MPKTPAIYRCDEASKRLVEANLKLVPYMVSRFAQHVGQFALLKLGGEDDAKQIGYLGLIRAAASPSRDDRVKFSTYAASAIWNSLSAAFRKRGRRREDTQLDFEDSLACRRPVHQDDMSDSIKKLRDNLTDQQREFFDLKLVGQGLTEIARKMNIGYNRAKKLSYQIKCVARQCLSKTADAG